MKKISLLLFFTIQYSLFTIHCSAQKQGQALTDSLHQALKDFDAGKMKPHKSLSADEGDTAKVILLKNLSWQYIQIADFDMYFVNT